MSIHKDKIRNTYYVKYSNITKRGFHSKKEAQKYEAGLRLRIEKYGVSNDVFLFKVMAKDFIENRKIELAYASYALYKQIINHNIIPQFKDKFITDIDEKDCKEFKEYVSNLNLSTRRKNRVLYLFKNIFVYANDIYSISYNPTGIIKSFSSNYEDKIRKKNSEMRIWTNNEFNLFIHQINDEVYKLFFITLFYTGMRLGEIQAITWNDLTRNNISITKALSKVCESGGYIIKYPKNVSSIRDITINNSLYLYLLDYQKKEKAKDGYLDSWFIFGGDTPLSRTSLERIKNNAIRQSGVKKIRIHDFRHSHASNLIGDGADIVAVSKRLGHSDVMTTLQIYTHLLPKNDDKLVELIENSTQNLLTK